MCSDQSDCDCNHVCNNPTLINQCHEVWTFAHFHVSEWDKGTPHPDRVNKMLEIISGFNNKISNVNCPNKETTINVCSLLMDMLSNSQTNERSN